MQTNACVRRFVAVVLAALVAPCAGALAQGYPSKVVRIIIPFSAGGGTDIQGRFLAKLFQESMGENFIVENRPGASGLIGTEAVVHAQPDGHTILFSTASLAVNATLLRERMKFDPLKDLAPVTQVSSVPLVLVIHPSVPAKSTDQLINLAKRGSLIAASNGAGTTSHLSIELLKQETGAKLLHVPYKGGGPSMTGLLTGEVDMLFATALVAKPQVAAGKVRAIAVTTRKSSAAFPGVPTIATALPGFETDNWYAMWFPAGTSRGVVDKLHMEVAKALKDPELQAFMRKEGAEPVGSGPAEFGAFFRSEIEKYGAIIRKAGLLGTKAM